MNSSVNKIFSGVGYLTFFIGAVGLVIFFGAFGGVGKALSYGEIVRSFSVSLTDFIPYRASVLYAPARLITVSPIMFMYLLFNRKKKIRDFWFILASLILSILFLLFNSGRGPLITLLFPVIFIFDRFFTRPWTASLILGLLLLPLLDILDSLFLFFSYGSFRQQCLLQNITGNKESLILDMSISSFIHSGIF